MQPIVARYCFFYFDAAFIIIFMAVFFYGGIMLIEIEREII